MTYTIFKIVKAYNIVNKWKVLTHITLIAGLFFISRPHRTTQSIIRIRLKEFIQWRD